MLRGGDLCVCQLTAVLELAASTVSSHLRDLRRAGLVTERKSGKWVHYRLVTTGPLADLVREALRLVDEDDRLRKDTRLVEDIRRIPLETFCRTGGAGRPRRRPGWRRRPAPRRRPPGDRHERRPRRSRQRDCRFSIGTSRSGSSSRWAIGVGGGYLVPGLVPPEPVQRRDDVHPHRDRPHPDDVSAAGEGPLRGTGRGLPQRAGPGAVARPELGRRARS